MFETNRDYLIWTNGRVALRPGDHVIKTLALFIPKQLIETIFRAFSHERVFMLSFHIAEPGGKPLDDTQSVVPKCLNLNRLTVTWSDYVFVNLCIHPRQLNTGFP